MNPKGNLSQPPYSSQTGRSLSRPPSRLPEGYKPGSSLPPGYLPPMRDLQKTGAMVREADRAKLTRRQIIMLAAGSVAIVLLIAAIAAAFIIQSSLGSIGPIGTNSPETTIQHYYSDLKVPDYASAYALLSPSAQQKLSRADYINNLKQIDGLNGTIVDFTIQKDTVKGNQATATVQYTRDPSQPKVTIDTVQLVQTNGAWLINSIVSENVVPTPAP